MRKSSLSAAFVFAWAVFISSCTTPSRPVIRYQITNRTNQRITTITQLEATDRLFAMADSTPVVGRSADHYLGIPVDKYQFQPYLKVLIQTTGKRYSTPVLAYKGRCTAFLIDVSESGVSVEESSYYRIRSQLINWYIVFMITFSIKGGALLLLASRYARNLLLPFAVLNTALVVFFQVVSQQSAGALEWRFLYYAIIPVAALECASYYRLGGKGRRIGWLLSGIVLGNLLWVFPGYLLILMGRFIFASC